MDVGDGENSSPFRRRGATSGTKEVLRADADGGGTGIRWVRRRTLGLRFSAPERSAIMSAGVFHRILVADDCSPDGERAASVAVNLGAKFKAEVILLGVVEVGEIARRRDDG